DDLDVPSFLQ
nr:Chain P, Cell division protein FtsZ [Corynebacterium glutamicum ATCC 13032]6SAT_Q Chain Q, Cell division protein FtsZ [Corynebacterium glutamicum ATCC 13032]6SCS_P Chain P, Cell division protein FtsZ [Corynebacterium glutamicum ATCC 13032]6SCS_Q Chain Q, Cell division protein FtsZ [Corynebacterium glutamicum ATCC 13032]6SCS_R Chain R, Cell division protein FtsZ [Corynebacterium glutamicum ATCC 13032]6SCS_S Chain S, Cell division protein FtsZ [Corynebacterium glutamicum ATCC 13032]8BVF_C Ch